MRILYVGMAHDYGRPELGQSFEEATFRSTLEGMGQEVVAYDFKARELGIGREAMHAELETLARRIEPDLVFFFLFEDELPPAAVRRIGDASGAPTVNWFADDHWRFDDFSRLYVDALDWVVTTDPDAVPRWRQAGQESVILSQWAVNRYAFRRVTTALEHAVTFVGMPHGSRPQIIEAIRAAGHDVECFGRGWPAGRIGRERMVRVFSSSAINLNLSNSSVPNLSLRARIGALVRGIEHRPRPPQIKGRNFEVPGCGGFLLTERVQHLEMYFELEREVATFEGTDELIDRIGHWLGHPEERAAVAEAGYQRVVREHTYDHRFAEIFRRMRLPGSFPSPRSPGHVQRT